MQLIKENFSTIKINQEIIQVLTLAPVNWTIKKVANFFNVTEYAARKARSLVQGKGIIGCAWQKNGKNLSEDEINLAKVFYEDDAFSQQMPGKKIMLVFLAIPINKNN